MVLRGLEEEEMKACSRPKPSDWCADVNDLLHSTGE